MLSEHKKGETIGLDCIVGKNFKCGNVLCDSCVLAVQLQFVVMALSVPDDWKNVVIFPFNKNECKNYRRLINWKVFEREQGCDHECNLGSTI